MEYKIISEKAKGYDVLKGALDGDIEYNTITRTKHTITDEDLGKIIDDYDYYIYCKDRMFHRCNKDGKLGAKYQDRFLNYKVLEKDFEFYKILEEEEKKIPEKLEEFGLIQYNLDYIDYKNIETLKEWLNKDFQTIYDTLDLIIKNQNKLIDYLKSKGE